MENNLHPINSQEIDKIYLGSNKKNRVTKTRTVRKSVVLILINQYLS